jgi:pyruvate,orthophosphate dikinase
MYIVHFTDAEQIPAEDRRMLLGGKGASLVEMSSDFGLAVPPGFVITTEAFKRFQKDKSLSFLDKELVHAMAVIESSTGRSFGSPDNPLLVSVRSGAPVSMPGMMDTILNLGLNDQTTSGLEARSNFNFTAECTSRFESMFNEIVIQKNNTDTTHIPSDVWEQLHLAIEAVFHSWNSPRAITYREVEKIPEHYGTAVTVQAMVFGNIGTNSGTGVLFTRNPSTGADELFGDFLPNAQGEDVVSGSHQTFGIEEMKEIAPDIFQELSDVAKSLEVTTTDMCDIEFTVEEGRLWILQNRVGKRTPTAAIRIAVEMAEDLSFPINQEEALNRVTPDQLESALETNQVSSSSEILAKGLGASPGVATGSLVFSADAAVEESDKGTHVLLVRPETSPADVHGMAVSQGIITATGGLASHAAVVARGWGIPAVVGVAELTFDGDSVSFGDRIFSVGEVVTLDGTTGEIFYGNTEVQTSKLNPEVDVFLTWLEAAVEKLQSGTVKDALPEEKLRVIQNIYNLK